MKTVELEGCSIEASGGHIWVGKDWDQEPFSVGDLVRFPTGKLYRVEQRFEKDGRVTFGLREWRW